jgi:phosphoribosylglycinamide formyltransferase-1
MQKIAFIVSGNGSLFMSSVRLSNIIRSQVAFLMIEDTANQNLIKFCIEKSIPCYVESIKNKKSFFNKLENLLEQYKPDYIVLTFNWLIPAHIVDNYKNRIINVHMSILPAFAGLNSLANNLSQCTKYAGATIHLVSNGIDDGPIISQCATYLAPNDTIDEVGKRIYKLLEKAFLQTLLWFADNRVIIEDRKVTIENAQYKFDQIIPNLENDIEKCFDLES